VINLSPNILQAVGQKWISKRFHHKSELCICPSETIRCTSSICSQCEVSFTCHSPVKVDAEADPASTEVCQNSRWHCREWTCT